MSCPGTRNRLKCTYCIETFNFRRIFAFAHLFSGNVIYDIHIVEHFLIHSIYLDLIILKSLVTWVHQWSLVTVNMLRFS